MAEQTLIWARKLSDKSPVSLEIRFTGEGIAPIKNWLGEDLSCTAQGDGDLGQRMERAFVEAFQDGMERVLIVGTDCPGLTAETARQAFARLDDFDIVLGPARDGGYYLIGLKRSAPGLFRGIPWGTEQVLEKTLATANEIPLRVSLLDPLDDVDRTHDLFIWERIVERDFPSISIIIPTFNEEENILSCLAGTRHAPNVERIVVDGGSRDRTREIASSCGAKVLTAPTGRARQMNAGAEAAQGSLLLFLHADTRLPEEYAAMVRHTLSRPGVAAGAFEFRLHASSPGLRFIERAANWRSRYLQLPYGDQAIFLRSALFREMGGYRDMPIMEDFELIQRLKKRGRIFTVPIPAITSARRWQKLGVWQTTLRNYGIVIAYHLGISPRGLRRFAKRG
jgi:rSAM/selenodomain-associated transferase 2/rSAM/selenodomain-associated transferase 1